MMARYFKDIFVLYSFKNKKHLRNLYNKLHHKKDIKINFVNYLLIKAANKSKFYEFGQTLFEKIFFLKFLDKMFNLKLNLKKISWVGNDISKMFNFFCFNFYKDLKLKVYEKPHYDSIKNSIFFSKGVTLLYEQNNIKLLRYVLKKSSCGSFDFSICKKKKTKLLNTGFKLYYASIKEFLDIIPKNKVLYFKNFKKRGKFIYFEVVFGKQKIIDNYFEILKKTKTKYLKNSLYKKVFDLNVKFYDLKKFKNYISSN
jgi:hypothetical protein